MDNQTTTPQEKQLTDIVEMSAKQYAEYKDLTPAAISQKIKQNKLDSDVIQVKQFGRFYVLVVKKS